MFCLCSRMKDSITKLDIFKMLKTIKDLFLCLKTYFHDNQSANHLKKAQSTQFTLMWQRKQQILWFKRRKCEYFAWFLRFLHLICLFAVCVMSMCVCVCTQSFRRAGGWAAGLRLQRSIGFVNRRGERGAVAHSLLQEERQWMKVSGEIQTCYTGL